MKLQIDILTEGMWQPKAKLTDVSEQVAYAYSSRVALFFNKIARLRREEHTQGLFIPKVKV